MKAGNDLAELADELREVIARARFRGDKWVPFLPRVAEDRIIEETVKRWESALTEAGKAFPAEPQRCCADAPRSENRPMTAESIAQRFHEVYEELAPVYGWQTQDRSAVPWDQVPLANCRLMVKVIGRLIHEGVIDHGNCRPGAHQ